MASFLLSVDIAQCIVPLPQWDVRDGGHFVLHDRDSRLSRVRAAERATSRIWAARLLISLGSSDPSVTTGHDRAPTWPKGFVGSITHTRELLGVAVAKTSKVRGIGIDIENIVDAATAEQVDAVCLTPRELQLKRSSRSDGTVFSSICFSAKEALFKCLYPLTRELFDFADTEILCIDAHARAVQIRLLRDLSREYQRGEMLRGTFAIDHAHVYTAFQVAPQ